MFITPALRYAASTQVLTISDELLKKKYVVTIGKQKEQDLVLKGNHNSREAGCIVWQPSILYTGKNPARLSSGSDQTTLNKGSIAALHQGDHIEFPDDVTVRIPSKPPFPVRERDHSEDPTLLRNVSSRDTLILKEPSDEVQEGGTG